MADKINAAVRAPLTRERQKRRSVPVPPRNQGGGVFQQLWRSSTGQGRLPGEITPKDALDQIAVTLLVISGLLYIYFDAFAGIIRGVLPAMGLTLLSYLPAEVAIIALACDAAARFRGRETAIPMAVLLGLLLGEIYLSHLVKRQPLAMLFELYIWLPVFVMASLTQRRMQDRVIGALIPVFFIATFGVLLNIFIKFPWADATFEVLGQTKAAAREWSTFGMTRLAGFSRASYAAADQILIGYCVLEYRLKSLGARAIFWVLGLIGIHYTTSKAPELAMLLLPVTYFLIGRIRQTQGARRTWAANAMMGGWLLLVFAGPFVAMTFGSRLYPMGAGDRMSYNSLADRVVNTWPNAIALFDWTNPVQWLIGRGLGGIGSAQNLVEPELYNPGDNMAIFLFVMFGAMSFIFIYLIFRGGQRAINAGPRGRRDFVMIIAMLGIGATGDVIQDLVSAIVFGLACARPRSVRRKHDA